VRAVALGLPALILAVALSVPAHGEPLRLDSQRSQADFDVSVLLLFRGRGNFSHIEGEISVDADEYATVSARIPVNSLDMRRADQERWAKGPDFFDVERWPEILFHSDRVPLARLSEGGRLPGRLTIRGVERRMDFEIAPAACARPGYDCPVHASGWVRRSDFGLGEGRRTLSDRVRLRFDIMLVAG
jgi:polyisoprenoid-binding protein YceI